MKLPWKLPLLLDGATGTQLMAAGMPADACQEQWITEHPGILEALQHRYILAGSDVLYTPTFSANRKRLAAFGLDKRTGEINRKLASLTLGIAKSDPGRQVLTAGCMSTTGLNPAPWGDAPFAELEDIFGEQAVALKEAGVDLLACESMTSLSEARAALLASRETGLPVIVTLSIDKDGRTPSGARLLPSVITLQSMGAAAVGLNCSFGAVNMAEPLAEALPHSAVPLVAKPSAAASLSPAKFAKEMKKLMDAGAVILGGCSGTTPEHIAALRGVLDSHPIVAPREIDTDACAVDSEAFFLPDDINLSELISCDSVMADRLIDAEKNSNVALVNIAYMGDIDNLLEFGGMSRLPLALHTDSALLLDDALRRFPGRLIVDSMCEIEQTLLEDISAKYGAKLF